MVKVEGCSDCGNSPKNLFVQTMAVALDNNGRLHGRWSDATQDWEDIQTEISGMLRQSPIPLAEEWAIHDYEGLEGATLNEYSGIERAHVLALFMVEHRKLGAEVLNHFGGDLGEAEAAFEDYAGEHRSLADFAREITEQTTEIPDSLVNYIDYDAVARDVEINSQSCGYD